MRERKELRRVREGLRRKWRGDGRKGRTLKILHSVPPSLSGLCATQKTVARANVYNKHRACKKMEWIKGSEGLNKPVRRRVSLPSGSKEGERVSERPWRWRRRSTKTETLPLSAHSRFSALFVAGRKSLRRESRRVPPMAIFRVLCRRLLPVHDFEASRLVFWQEAHLSVAS